MRIARDTIQLETGKQRVIQKKIYTCLSINLLSTIILESNCGFVRSWVNLKAKMNISLNSSKQQVSQIGSCVDI